MQNCEKLILQFFIFYHVTPPSKNSFHFLQPENSICLDAKEIVKREIAKREIREKRDRKEIE
jgi:hypothetical protein